jgi:hypothetical protein
MALLIIKGLRYAPLVLAAELLSGATLPTAPVFPVLVFLGSLVVTGGYTGAAAILRHAGLQAGIGRGAELGAALSADFKGARNLSGALSVGKARRK